MSDNINKRRRFIPEFEPQDAVLLCWPHKSMDWNYILSDIEHCYEQIAKAILRFQPLVIACIEPTETLLHLQELSFPHTLRIITDIPLNDTWARDTAPLSLMEDGKPVLLDFAFNGWGLKYGWDKDNEIAASLQKHGVFAPNVVCRRKKDFVCEGGAVETDGCGTLLTTNSVQYEPNRNSKLSKQEILDVLKEEFGVEQVVSLSVDAMSGDDTDGHIDTLARFCSPDTIAYVGAPKDKSDIHFDSLVRMEQELQAMRNTKGEPYRLVKLPFVSPVYDPLRGERLPATYANFLLINGAVLLPVYNVPEDEEAIAVIKETFPDREVVAINCFTVVRQHGSLHCITMQFPKGFVQNI